ncbi:MAG: class I SAM-dependent methyltransferase [Bryobacterales bacterium]|nr:class I SAM-dependent methyltransferase [Bryobacterales bacterium]
MQTAIEFGYPWWLSYGHLAVLFPAVGALWMGRTRLWPRWALIMLTLISVWAVAALFVVARFAPTAVPALPTENFFRAGTGRLLDIGAGTGRSSIMALRARPQATLVALDQFGDSFGHHFGHDGPRPEERLIANLKAAGVADRATIAKSDMRKLPFEDASFDAVLSAYAIDHVGGQGARQALAEAARVLKPGGDFLLILVGNDGWTRFAYGPLLSHGGTRGIGWWTDRAREAKLEVIEQGSSPATIFLLLRRPRS